MPLLTIADLNQPQQDLAPYMEMAESLSDLYFNYIAGKQSDSYKYTVEIFSGKTRKPGIHASERRDSS